MSFYQNKIKREKEELEKQKQRKTDLEMELAITTDIIKEIQTRIEQLESSNKKMTEYNDKTAREAHEAAFEEKDTSTFSIEQPVKPAAQSRLNMFGNLFSKSGGKRNRTRKHKRR